jgi:SAM-dependent methyltransferase
LARRLTEHFAGKDRVRVVDLGCGSGSNLRATSGLLGPLQEWTLVDYDPRLLAAARATLSAWADKIETNNGTVVLTKGARQIMVRLRQADLNRELPAALGETPDLVTASALFDLCSTNFIDTFAKAVAQRHAAFYTVLTYDGVQDWRPAHAADASMLDAFRAHQMTDKGFGPSAGWTAPAALAKAFRMAGYTVGEATSPWILGEADARLIADLASGFADAVADTGKVSSDEIAAWRNVVRTAATVGHIDTLALPPG